MNIIVATFETDSKQYYDGLLRYTCKANNIPLTVLGVNEKWVGVKQLIFGYLDFVQSLSPDEIVICCDNRDVIIPANVDEILWLFQEMGQKVYFGVEIGCFPIWELEQHFDRPDVSNYRSEAKVLNSGVCIGRAGDLVDVFTYATRFYNDSFDMSSYLMSNYGISQKEINQAKKNYPSRFINSALECDQLALQLTYFETDLIDLDYDCKLIFTSFVLPDSWIPNKKWRDEIHPDYPYATLFDIDFNWGKTYKSVFNTYNNSYPLIYHSPGSVFVMNQLKQVIRGSLSRSVGQMYVDRNNSGVLESFDDLEQFIQDSQHKESFVCWKNKNVPPLYDLMDLCVEYDKTLVIIVPKLKRYYQDLEYMISIAPENLRLFESTSFGFNSTLRARVRNYEKQFKNCIVVPESLYVDVLIEYGNP